MSTTNDNYQPQKNKDLIYISYNILNCNILTQGGATLNITSPVIESLEIYESISSPGISGKLIIQDVQGLKEMGMVTAGDTFNFSFQTISGQIFNNSFIISGTHMDEMLQDELLMNVSQFEFMSPWYMSGIIQPYSYNWKNKSLDKISTDLITYSGGSPGTIESSNVTLETFSSVYWSPIHTITYLLDFYGPGMVLYTDIQTGKVNLVSLNSIFGGKMGTVTNSLSMLNPNSNYEGYVYHETVEQTSDLVRYVGNGLGNTNINAFNYDQKQFQVPTPSVISNKISFNHYATKSTILNKYTNSQYSKEKFYTIYPTGQSPVSNSQLNTIISNKLSTHYIRLFSNAIKLNVYANPSTNRKCGQVVDLVVPSLKNNKSEPNQELSGKYVIESIKRVFKGNNAREYISLINTGYINNTNPNLMVW